MIEAITFIVVVFSSGFLVGQWSLKYKQKKQLVDSITKQIAAEENAGLKVVSIHSKFKKRKSIEC